MHKYENTVRLMRYNNHVRYTINITAVCKIFPCLICNNFFIRAHNLDRQSTVINEQTRIIYLAKVNQISEKLFVHLGTVGIEKASQQKLIKVFVKFDPKSVCNLKKVFKVMKTKIWIVEQIQISVSTYPNPAKRPIFNTVVLLVTRVHYLSDFRTDWQQETKETRKTGFSISKKQ